MKSTELINIDNLKLKFINTKTNDYGTYHFFVVQNEDLLKRIVSLSEKNELKLPAWKYNGTWFIKITDKKVSEYHDIEFKKDIVYDICLGFEKYNFEKGGETLKGYYISQIINKT